MTADGLNSSMVYDGESRLVSLNNSAATYSYDGNNLRVKKVASGTTTVYLFSGSKVVAEYDNGAAVGSPSREYIYSGGALVAKVEGSATKYYHQDHLSNRVITDANGTAVEQHGHFPFGEDWYPGGDKWKFTTYERDAESGNDYAMARFHVNRLGRFSSPDLLAGSVLDPQSLNRYTYAANDPGNLVDRLGLCVPDIELCYANHDPGSGGGGNSFGGFCPAEFHSCFALADRFFIGFDGVSTGKSCRYIQPGEAEAPADSYVCDDDSDIVVVVRGDPSGGNPGGNRSWWGTFVKEFFKLSGGPGNVPTCAEVALRNIGQEFIPFSPAGAPVIQATAPAAQAMAFNSAVAETEAGIDAYVAGKGLTVPLRSGVVRAMAAQGAESAVAAGARANFAVQTFAVDYAAVKSTYITSGEARNGQCAAAFPIF